MSSFCFGLFENSFQFVQLQFKRFCVFCNTSVSLSSNIALTPTPNCPCFQPFFTMYCFACFYTCTLDHFACHVFVMLSFQFKTLLQREALLLLPSEVDIKKPKHVLLSMNFHMSLPLSVGTVNFEFLVLVSCGYIL